MESVVFGLRSWVFGQQGRSAVCGLRSAARGECNSSRTPASGPNPSTSLRARFFSKERRVSGAVALRSFSDGQRSTVNGQRAQRSKLWRSTVNRQRSTLFLLAYSLHPTLCLSDRLF